MDAAATPQLRSALFVPAHRADLIAKAAASAADALILDLEDSVPPAERGRARANVAAAVADPRDGPRLCVRINGLGAGALEADLDAAVGLGLLAVVVPKVASAADIARVSAALTAREGGGRAPAGAIRIWPLIENAAAVLAGAEIAAADPRIAYFGGGTSPGGDLAASLGYEWTPDGDETLYLRSKLLIDARAAGVPHPMTGVVTQLDDLSLVRRFAEQSRRLGYEGLMVIHPSHIAIANEVFGVDSAQRERAIAVLRALDDAELDGHSAVTHQGGMIDAAMRAGAESVLRRRSADSADLSE